MTNKDDVKTIQQCWDMLYKLQSTLDELTLIKDTYESRVAMLNTMVERVEKLQDNKPIIISKANVPDRFDIVSYQ